MVPYATEDLPTAEIDVDTPLEKTKGLQLEGGTPVVVSVLRAGNGLLDGVLTILSDADVGFIGLEREHQTFNKI